MKDQTLCANDLAEVKIKIYEPFAEFLMADQEEFKFSISLLDVVRFAGHACPSIVGAFFISKRAVEELFPEDQICHRGQVSIQLSSLVEQGATGPISNVFSMIFGSWEKSGFGGLGGRFIRRGLLQYGSTELPSKSFRFKNIATNETIDIYYDPSKVEVNSSEKDLPFQKIWRQKIGMIIKNPNQFLTVTRQK